MKGRSKISKEALRLLRSNPSVVGFSATLKDELVRGKPSGRLAIRVYVKRKLPKNKILKERLLPENIGGVLVDVVEIGEVELGQGGAPGHVEKFRPLQGGISACSTHAGASAGTLGYFLRERKPPPHPPNKPQWYILSCAHVLNGASSGLETLQPSGGDGGVAPNDWVGRESLYTYDGVDAAIAAIDAGAIAAIVGLPSPIGTERAKEGLTVAKSGRTTGVTYGRIIDDDFELRNLRYPDGANRSFRRCLLIENRHHDFANRGDSGSLVIDPVEERPVGMIFAVSHVGAHWRGIANPIDRVLRAFPNQTMVMPGESYP